MENLIVMAIAAGTFIGSLLAGWVAGKRAQHGETVLIEQRQTTQQGDINTLRSELNALRLRYEIDVAALRANVSLVTELFEKSVEKRTLQNQEIESLRREVATLTAQVVELEARGRGKEALIANQSGEIAALKGIIEKQKAEVERLNQERIKVGELLVTLRNELSDYKALSASRQEEIEELKKEADSGSEETGTVQHHTGTDGTDLPSPA